MCELPPLHLALDRRGRLHSSWVRVAARHCKHSAALALNGRSLHRHLSSIGKVARAAAECGWLRYIERHAQFYLRNKVGHADRILAVATGSVSRVVE
jgi:hypothetical protein